MASPAHQEKSGNPWIPAILRSEIEDFFRRTGRQGPVPALVSFGQLLSLSEPTATGSSLLVITGPSAREGP
jgi:hypothetical protein